MIILKWKHRIEDVKGICPSWTPDSHSVDVAHHCGSLWHCCHSCWFYWWYLFFHSANMTYQTYQTHRFVSDQESRALQRGHQHLVRVPSNRVNSLSNKWKMTERGYIPPQEDAVLQVYVLLWSPNLPVTEKLVCRCIDSMSWSFDKEWKSQDKIIGTTIKICTIKWQRLLVEIKIYFYVLYRELQLCVTLKKISYYIVCLGGFVRSVYLWMPFNKCLCFLDMIAAPPQHAWAQTDRRGKYWWATLSDRRD